MRKVSFIFLQAVCLLLWGVYSTASTEDILAGILNLTEAEFFSADETEQDQREFQLVDLDFWGVAVNAPGEIKTVRHKKLPLFIATRYSGERGWHVPFKDNCILVGTNLRDGTVHFRKAMVSERELESRWRKTKTPRGPMPSGLPIRAALIRTVDVRQSLNVKWNTGTWALGVINYDWPSNTVVVELQGDEDVKPSPARPVDPDPNPSVGALPSCLPIPKTPKLSKPGVVFTIEAGEENGKKKLDVFGSFSIPVRDYYLPEQKSAHAFQDGRKENVAAVVPATLAVLGLDWEVPMQFDRAIPVYGKELEVGEAAQGCFAINAFSSKDVRPLRSGKYICYLIMDGRIFGPQLFEISE